MAACRRTPILVVHTYARCTVIRACANAHSNIFGSGIKVRYRTSNCVSLNTCTDDSAVEHTCSYARTLSVLHVRICIIHHRHANLTALNVFFFFFSSCVFRFLVFHHILYRVVVNTHACTQSAHSAQEEDVGADNQKFSIKGRRKTSLAP